ncbi:glycosyltransferase family 2 protein [Orbus mooreae]|uniref:glycosyltransferase family 2 protein n=1 Tax=Orbus mooreae TaxID=3074107 RepID=UPI00370D79B6
MSIKTILSDSAYKYCFVIPCYNHSNTLFKVLENLELYQIDCFLIDDGSDITQADILQHLAAQFAWVTLIRLPTNQGKGAAVMTGIQHAYSQGYSHAIQIDADGQHNCQDITKLIEVSHQYPELLISGQPIYDESVPKHRLIARYITHVWVWIETLSFSIKDSMCGFRIYPLANTVGVIKKYSIGHRMDFDTEIMVRLYWERTPTIFVPTKVIYPKDGVSHFKAFKDNLLISWMHTKLFFGMLPRAISLLKQNRSVKSTQLHWSQTKERQGLWGIKFILSLYRWLGRRAAKWIMLPVITYFWLTGTNQRKASKAYLQKINQHYDRVALVEQKKLTTFHHFYRFGESLLDKLASWQGDIKINDLYYPDKKQCLDIIEKQQGIILIGSHLGDLEMCRAIANLSHNVTINALVFTHHAKRFNQVLKEVNPTSTINLIQVDTLGADTAILLKQKLDAGEWIAIVGDRTSTNIHQRTSENSVIWANFLGQPAPFPKGPFILSAVLGFPVYLIWGLKPNGRFQFYFEHFTDKLILPRKDRDAVLSSIVQNYASRLEHYCLISPLDWFNFYDFWRFTPPKPHNIETSTTHNEK